MFLFYRSGFAWPGLVLLTLAFTAPAVTADTAPDVKTTTTSERPASKPVRTRTLQPFRAEYRVSVSRVPTPIRAELVLEAGDTDGVYRMQMSVDSRLMQNTELSIFRWEDCQPYTQHYMHYFRGFRRERDHFMDFVWDSDTPRVINASTGNGEEELSEYDIEPGTVDELTMMLIAPCLMTDEQTEYSVTTAYGTRVREHHIQVVGHETLRTPLGEVETVRIEKRRDADSSRYTVFWLAPELDYMLVRGRHVESRGLYGELRLVDYEGPFSNASE
ncbi:MAG: DUF3108 domain-containing protein [Alcanivorax sp.]|nr:DUF3108 domain-containing protein [Alcanivorax sp.]